MRERPGRLRIHRERQVAIRLVHDLVSREAVVADQPVGLIQSMLAQRRCRGRVLHGRVSNRTERAEVRVMDAAAGIERRHAIHDGAVGVGRGSDDELHRHAGDAARPTAVAWPAGTLLLAIVDDDATRPLQRDERSRHLLLRCDPLERIAAGCLEVHRHPRGQRCDPLDLRRLGSRNQLHVDIAREPVPDAEQLEHGDQIVGDLLWPGRDAGGDEQPLAPPATQGAEEDANELLGLEERPAHRAIATHGAVVAVQRTRIRHQNAQQLDRTARTAKHADVERSKSAGVSRIPQPRRERLRRLWWPFPVLCRERHEDVELLAQFQLAHDGQLPCGSGHTITE